MSLPALGSGLFAMALALSCPVRAGADAVIRSNAMMATTIAEYFVEDGGITVELEIGGPDLLAFRNLLPDELHAKITPAEIAGEPRPLAERLHEFFERDFPIAIPGTPPLEGQILEMGPRTRVRRDSVSGEPLPGVEGETDVVLFARLAFPFDARPDELVFSALPGTQHRSVRRIA
jgi:hypothetical protein